MTHGRDSPGVGRERAASQEMRLHPFQEGLGLQEGFDIKKHGESAAFSLQGQGCGVLPGGHRDSDLDRHPTFPEPD